MLIPLVTIGAHAGLNVNAAGKMDVAPQLPHAAAAAGHDAKYYLHI